MAVIEKFDYVFAENGTVQYKDGKLLSKQVDGIQGGYTHTCGKLSWERKQVFWKVHVWKVE